MTLPRFLTLALLPVAAAAADVEPTTALDPIQVTAGGYAQTTGAAAQAVSVVSREQIEQQTPQTLPDLLRGTPGVFVQQTTPGQGIAIIRGLKGSEVLHLVDGIRLNHAFFRNAPNQYLALVDPYTIDHAEVVRGPSPSLYGSDAMGGVVNLITRQPEFGSDDWSVQARVRGGASSAENASVGHTAVAAGTRRVSLDASATYQDYDNRRIGGGETLSPTAFRSEAGQFGARWQASEAIALRLNLQTLRQPSTPRFDQLTPGFGQTEPRRAEFAFEPSRRDYAHLSLDWMAPFRAADTLRIDLAHQRIVDDTRRRSVDSANRDLEDNSSNLSAVVVTATSQISDTHHLTYGAEVYHDRVYSRTRRINLDSGDLRLRESRFPDGSTMISSALFASHDIEISDATRLTAGARASRFDIELTADEQRLPADLSINDLTGNLGLNHRLGHGWAVTANVGRGFRAPNIFDLGAIGPRPDNRFNQANPDLGPESVYSYDLGLKSRGPRHRLEGFVFYSDYRDKIVSVFTGEQTDAGEDVVISDNVSSVKLYGAELDGEWQLTRHIAAFAGASWVYGEQTDPDGAVSPADRIPPLNGQFGVRWDTTSSLQVTLWLRGAARQDRLSDRDIADSRINPDGTPGWTTLNVRTDWQVSHRWRLIATAENILDKRYREHASGIDARGIDASLAVEWNWY